MLYYDNSIAHENPLFQELYFCYEQYISKEAFGISQCKKTKVIHGVFHIDLVFWTTGVWGGNEVKM